MVIPPLAVKLALLALILVSFEPKQPLLRSQPIGRSRPSTRDRGRVQRCGSLA